VAAEYEVNIKINSEEIERQLKDIDTTVSKIGKSKGRGSKGKSAIAGLLPSSAELKAADRGIVQLIDRFAQRKERAIERSNALNRADLKINKQLVQQARNRVRLQGAADGAMQGKGRMAAENIDTRARVQERKLKLVNKVNELEAKGLGVQKLRNQIGKISTQQSAKRFASAEKEIRLLRKMLEIDQSRTRILRSQGQNLPSSPIGGGLGFPGSPGFLAGETVSKTPFGPAGNFPTSLGAGGARSPVRGGLRIAGSPIQMEAIKKLEMAEIRANKNVHFAELKDIQKRQQVQMNNIDKELAKDIRALNAFDKKLAASDRKREKTLEAARKGRNKRLEGVALGAGFPMLFGGGAGSVAGGALGGLTESFGAQIAFSAIGQQIDQFVASVIDAGRAFGSLSETLDLMRERSLFTSKGSEELARQLEELGDVEGLAELATIELASKIGSEGIEAFQDLEAEIDEFDRLAASLTLSLQAFLAGPLAGFLNIINATLGKQVTRGTVDRLAASLTDPAGREKFLAEATKQIGTQIDVTGFGFGGAAGLPRSEKGLKPASLDLLSDLQRRVAGGEEFGPSTLLSRKVRITRQDRDSFKTDSSIEKAAREEERLQKRLDKLEIERQKVLDISSLKDKIAAAEQAGDKFTVIRLKGQQKLKDIEAKRLKDLTGITKQSEIRGINELAAAKVVAAQADTAREINELEFKRQEKFKDTIQGLDHQLALARATTEEERERLRIEERMRVLRDGKDLDEDQLADIKLRMEALADENSPINTFIKQIQAQIDQLNDPVFQAIELAKTLGDAFSESFRGIIDGSMTAQQALANLFQRTANHFLDMAMQMIAAQVKMQAVNLFMNFFNPFGGLMAPGGRYAGQPGPLAPTPPPLPPIPGMARGGAVAAGRPYMVGERGPELFVPGAQGNIVPNNALGGSSNVTVNVDASGSNVEGSADQAAQLGKAIGVAVQQELIKQRRPGGLLTG